MDKPDLKKKKLKPKRALSVYNLLNKKYEVIPFTGEWEAAFGRPESKGIWFISGKPTNGKSTFCMQLVKELASLGMRTAYFSWEEGSGLSFQHTVKRAGWAEHSRNIVIEDSLVPFARLPDWIAAHPRVKVIVIDTVQKWDIRKKDIATLHERYGNKLFVFISHVKEGGSPDGAIATEILRDASMKIWVEGFRAISRGRHFGPVGYYAIWKERAEKYYAENI
ncbi:MAG: hypothetical protein LBF62_05875 [Tannerellaceae bacterium]|jgi:hypothetical protein|nr:hypothetical protein [Tannerellaceae bacterium]